eukprot:ANDGO_03961.mRNA.1 GPI ethanolamine phosphate transferase 3
MAVRFVRLHHISQVSLFFFLAFVAGIVCFTAGFLLTRTTLEARSTSRDIAHASDWARRKFDNMVLVCVDGLRYDMADPSVVVPEDDTYRGKFKFVRSLLQKEPSRASFSKFVADAPTATYQRLKGITTGSLPTFIDVGTQFDNDNLTEDTWLDHLRDQNRTVVQIGDEMWSLLFSDDRIARIHNGPSLNVFDLYTVDEVVDQYKLQELAKENGPWELLILHYLGLDHAGHRYSVHDPNMAERASHYDTELRRAIDHQPKNTVFIMFGDHGMTDTGDHGGASSLEVDSLLFWYSKDLPFFSENEEIRELLRDFRRLSVHDMSTRTATDPFGLILPFPVIPQVDFVPTICYVFGLPIPFANIGRMIPEVAFSLGGRYLRSLWRGTQAASTSFEPYMSRYAEQYETNMQDPELQKLVSSRQAVRDFVGSTLEGLFGAQSKSPLSGRFARISEKFELLASKVEQLLESGNKATIEELATGFYALLDSQLVNAFQIHRYVQEYARLAHKLPLDEAHDIYFAVQQKMAPLISGFSTKNLNEKELGTKTFFLFAASFLIDEYMAAIHQVCREQWAEFDLFGMVLGLTTVLVACGTCAAFVSVLVHVKTSIFWPRRAVFVFGLVGLFCGVLLDEMQLRPFVPALHATHFASIVALFSCIGFVFAICIRLRMDAMSPFRLVSIPVSRPTLVYLSSKDKRIPLLPSWSSLRVWSTVSVVLIRCHGLFSNSYIVQEDKLTTFCLATMWLVQVRTIWRILPSKASPVKPFLLWVCIIVAGLCTRLFHMGIRWRSLETHVIEPSQHTKLNPIIAVITLTVILVVIRSVLRMAIPPFQKKKEFSLLLQGSIVLVYLYWVLAELLDPFPLLVDIWVPRTVYLVSFACCFFFTLPTLVLRALALFPTLMILSGHQNMGPFAVMISHAASILVLEHYIIFHQLLDFRVIDDSEHHLRVVAPYELEADEEQSGHASRKHRSARTATYVAHYSILLIPSVVLWTLLCLAHFFGTGHQCTFSTIDWNAAFIGFKGYTVPWSGIPLMLAEFSAPVLFNLVAPILPYLLFPRVLWNAENGHGKEIVNLSSVVAGVTYVGLWGFYACMTLVFVWWERRHLMMWAIFAPKFVFDILFFVLSALFVFGFSWKAKKA